MNEISKKYGIKFGMILSVYYIILNTILFFTDPTLFTDPKIGVISIVFVPLLGVICVYFTKRSFDNVITLKQAFSAFLVMITIGFVFNQILLYILFNFVNPEYIEINNNILIQMVREKANALGIKSADLENQVAELRRDNQYAFQTLFYSLAKSIVFASIAGLLISLVFRNKSEIPPKK